MNWREIYTQKICSIEELLKGIKSGSVITTAVIPMTPQTFFANLHRVPEDVRDLQVFTILNPNTYEFFFNKENEGRFMNNCWFYGRGDRAAVESGLKTVSYVPNNSHQAIEIGRASCRERV